MKKQKYIEWAIQLIVLAFSAGGVYVTIRNHETRITRIEDHVSDYMLKHDFEERIKTIEWRLNRGR